MRQVRRTARGLLGVGIRHEVRISGVVLYIVVRERRRWCIDRADFDELCPVRRREGYEGAHGAPDRVTFVPANLAHSGRRPAHGHEMGFGGLKSRYTSRRIGSGASGFRVLLVAADRIQGVAANRIQGVAANCIQGIAANRIERVATNRVEGVAANRIERIPANRVKGVAAG